MMVPSSPQRNGRSSGNENRRRGCLALAIDPMDFKDRHYRMTDSAPLKISKLDAARHQLRTAITLWFNDGDPIAIHALAFASYEILHAVSKKRNPSRRKLVFDSDLIPEELRKEVNIALKQSANFFKHADHDPEAIIEFNPGMSDCFIIFAISALQLCGESNGDEENAFLLWIHTHKPHLLTGAGEKKLIDNLPVEVLRQLRGTAKNNFLHFLHTCKLAHAYRRRR
jgi:hypothetical protein